MTSSTPSNPSPTEGVEPVSEVRRILAKLSNVSRLGSTTERVEAYDEAVAAIERLVAEAKMQGFHEGRYAANNPEYQYGYSAGGELNQMKGQTTDG